MSSLLPPLGAPGALHLELLVLSRLPLPAPETPCAQPTTRLAKRSAERSSDAPLTERLLSAPDASASWRLQLAPSMVEVGAAQLISTSLIELSRTSCRLRLLDR